MLSSTVEAVSLAVQYPRLQFRQPGEEHPKSDCYRERRKQLICDGLPTQPSESRSSFMRIRNDYKKLCLGASLTAIWYTSDITMQHCATQLGSHDGAGHMSASYLVASVQQSLPCTPGKRLPDNFCRCKEDRGSQLSKPAFATRCRRSSWLMCSISF